MADYKPGSMDIRAQEKAFKGLIKGSIIVVCFAVAALIFMALANH